MTRFCLALLLFLTSPWMSPALCEPRGQEPEPDPLSARSHDPRSSSREAGGEWVQLTLSGELVASGGGRIEIEVGAISTHGGDRGRQVLLAPHLAQGTSAGDIAALLAERLERAGFDVWLSEPRTFDGKVRRHLFLEHALFLRLRLGFGLEATVTVCEGLPSAVRIEPPRLSKVDANLELAFTTVHAHSGEQGRETLDLALASDTHPAQISSDLTRACLDRKWMADRPRLDSWRLVQAGNGARVAGVSIGLATGGDWRLEVEFAR